MKNIHVLPTDKPSRLYKSIFWDLKDKQKLKLTNVPIYKNSAFIKYNIYITNDEEIKDKCYVLSSNSITPLFLDGVINTASMLAENQWRKVILTDNKDLIKDGIQAIDDEFLEWFVKNPSCEFVKTKLIAVNEYCSEITTTGYGFDKFIYKIIIPSEEPKQKMDINTCRYFDIEVGCEREECICANTHYEEPKQDIIMELEKDPLLKEFDNRVSKNLYILKNKQETEENIIEEAKKIWDELHPNPIEMALFGAKWQQEQDKNFYSEEEVFDLLQNFNQNAMEYIKQDGRNIMTSVTLQKWFKQFKKK